MRPCKHLRDGNACHQWPDRVKYVTDEHRDTVCLSVSRQYCVWLTTVNPEREAEMTPDERDQAIAERRRLAGRLRMTGRPVIYGPDVVARVVELRQAGATWTQIGVKLSISATSCERLYRRAAA